MNTGVQIPYWRDVKHVTTEACMSFETLRVERTGPVETVLLNRPDVRNAFNPQVIAELRNWAAHLDEGAVRVAILGGAGRVFSAGGDLTWMSAMVGASREDNLADARELAGMFEALDHLPVPLVGRIQGAALGGGAGLAAVCDIVVAEEGAMFGFTEVKLGLVPSVIAPYALAKIGPSAARELFLTGARFPAARAREIGLVHAVVPASELDGAVAAYVAELLTSSPGAVAIAKDLVRRIAGLTPAAAARVTTETIAARRVSAEGQAGMRAFLDKRQPEWAVRRDKGGGQD
jgi:methylglutaconyl-CoA hydratase